MSRDLRDYARQTNLRLFIGALVLIFLVGDGLIYLIYGKDAATLGLMCIVAGLSPVVIITITMWLVDRMVKRALRK
jgi:hypothetical protein